MQNKGQKILQKIKMNFMIKQLFQTYRCASRHISTLQPSCIISCVSSDKIKSNSIKCQYNESTFHFRRGKNPHIHILKIDCKNHDVNSVMFHQC